MPRTVAFLFDSGGEDLVGDVLGQLRPVDRGKHYSYGNHNYPDKGP